MISTVPDHASFITVSVGKDVRIRDGHKNSMPEGQRSSEKPKTVLIADSNGNSTAEGAASSNQIHASVTRLQETLKHVDPRIELSVEKDINRVIFRVVDKESGDLIRQIPPEKVVELDRFLSEHSGLFVEENI